MISIAICEDSVPMQAQIEELTAGFLPDAAVDVYSTGEELIAELVNEKVKYSIYLMDISLPGISGIETAARIRERDPYALLIYITDYKEYVYQVFETLPFRFITKPVEAAKLEKAFSDAVNYIWNRCKMFYFHIGKKQYQILMQEIMFLESRLRQITLHLMDTSYEFYGRIPEVMNSLDTMFFARTHTSYIVNMEYIRCMSDTCITLRSGKVIPVSKRYRNELREKHLQYLKWRADE